MKVGEAREIGREWVREHLHEMPELWGVMFNGSTVWMPEDAELGPYSDVDIAQIQKNDSDKGMRVRKILYRGVVLETGTCSGSFLETAGRLPSRTSLCRSVYSEVPDHLRSAGEAGGGPEGSGGELREARVGVAKVRIRRKVAADLLYAPADLAGVSAGPGGRPRLSAGWLPNDSSHRKRPASDRPKGWHRFHGNDGDSRTRRRQRAAVRGDGKRADEQVGRRGAAVGSYSGV